MTRRCRKRASARGLVLGLLALLLFGDRAAAQKGVAGPIYDRNVDALIDGAEEWLDRLEQNGWLLRGQMTNTFLMHPRFRSPYRGQNSMAPPPDHTAMQTVDIVLGRRLWHNAEIIAVPSPTRGFGFSNNVGLGALANTESFHGGTKQWDWNITRLFLRQTIDISYDAFGTDVDPMRFTGPLARERITLTAGKLAVWDFFDTNAFAHEPRLQFLNYALVGAGAFDFASDAAGYTQGFVAEWENGVWAARFGGFQVARSQGSDFLDQYFWKGWQLLGEVNRFTWLGRFPGAIRFIAGASRTNSALYSQLTQAVLAGQEDTQNLRAYRTKPMLAANFDQQLNDTWGVFGRVGWNNGRNQNFHFIEMDWSVSAGVAVNGWRWGRFDDTAGLAINLGVLHAPQRQFIEAGGYGFIIGDGRLNYRPEAIFEAYYDFGLRPGVNFGLGSQAIINPNYNADRGPVLVGWLRARAAF